MLSQSVRGRLGPVLEGAVERGLVGLAGSNPQTLKRDLETVLDRGKNASDEQVALALAIALALSQGERPSP